MRNSIIFLILFLIGFVSCDKNKNIYLLEGDWLIENYYFKNVNYNDSLMLHLIIIDDKNKSISFPYTYTSKFIETLGKSVYSEDGDNKFITISNCIPEINGTHLIDFKNDTLNKHLVLIIRSKNVYIVAIKNRFGYEKMQNYLEDLPIYSNK